MIINERMKQLAGVIDEGDYTDKLDYAQFMAVIEFAQIKKEYEELKKKTKRLEEYSKELGETIEELVDELGDRIIEVDTGIKYRVELTKKSYERDSPKYKDAFELALTKVNGNIRKILEEALKETMGTAKYSAQFAVSMRKGGLNEGILEKLASLFDSAVKKFKSLIVDTRILKKDTDAFMKLAKSR